MKKIVLGVSSSIGIYKACEVLRGFQKHGYQVQVAMTRNATKLISPLLFSSLSGLNTIVDLFDDQVARTVGHVSLALEASLFCMAPATANVIAKFAGGIADDFPTTFFLAARCPVLVAPAMNDAMYIHPRTQANLTLLKALGVEFAEPDKGYLACGDEGWGRLAEPLIIVEKGLRLIGRTECLKGKTILVTAGPTREFMDPVRFISNPSSGKMGYELAREARARGAQTILVSGPTSLIPPEGVRFLEVGSAAEMKAAVLKEFPRADVVVMAAAVSDFRFKTQALRKESKQVIPLRIDLEGTSDILKILGQKKRRQLLVGFAAETNQALSRARAKMKDKKVDLMVANKVGEGMGFESDKNQVHIIRPSGKPQKTPVLSKREISRIIFDEIGGALDQKR